MSKDTKEIIAAIFLVGWIILAVLGYWFLGFILAFFYLLLPKTKEQLTEELHFNLLNHLFKKRDWSNKEQVMKDMEKELKEAKEITDKTEK